jgi:heterodisulfide reductase subunit C
MECGVCTGGCPVARLVENFSPRQIVEEVLLEGENEVLDDSSVWLCSTCGTCSERCPQNVTITDFITQLKNYLVKHGRVHPGVTAQAGPIYNDGRIYAIEEFDNKKREKMGLPAVKPKTQEAMKIFELTGLDKIVSNGSK